MTVASLSRWTSAACIVVREDEPAAGRVGVLVVPQQNPKRCLVGVALWSVKDLRET
jgi:hypothetical protein